ncbi:MAG: hypothetical protein LBK08_02055 [Treponema sp.]|jgi:hypothetical protein|nr:hypothetical protein [Treponema sp.]
MKIEIIDNKKILVVSREEFVELFAKGWPLFDDVNLANYFIDIGYKWNSKNYTHFVYNQFMEVCNFKGWVFKWERDRELVISTIKTGTPFIDFDDFIITF